MPYVNLKLGQRVHVTVTGVIEENARAGEGGQFLRLRHGTEGADLVSTVFIDDDSVDIAFDEPEEVPSAQRFPSAEELRPYMGKWVAVTAGLVHNSGDTLTAVLDSLRALGETADSTFYVPADRAEV